jgi:hypothetical protein
VVVHTTHTDSFTRVLVKASSQKGVLYLLRAIIMTKKCSRLLPLGTLLVSAGSQLGKSQMDGIPQF